MPTRIVTSGLVAARACKNALLEGLPAAIWTVGRSGMVAYDGAARRRVHLATVLLRPPSGYCPGRRQTRHARILQIGLHLTQT